MNPRSRQAGATLMETMIALALSVLVTTAMVVLMGNSMGTSNRITQMTQLTDELRNVMSMMTRDVRRANYSAASLLCYGNANCGNQDQTRQISGGSSGDLVVDTTVGAGCLIFQLDRLSNLDGNATNDSKGGFRRVVINGRGVIQMWVDAAATTPACNDSANADGWLAVTDPNIVDITGFTVDDSLSADVSVSQASGTLSYTQRQRQLRLSLEGELVLEQRMGWNQTDDPVMVRRHVEDVVKVRNDYLTPPS